MKSILLFDLAGVDFPGGCEKYFANLANYLSNSEKVTSITSPQYRKFMDYVYFIVTRRKLNSLQLVKRDIGKTSLFEITFWSLLPFSNPHNKVKRVLLQQDRIYAKNEFQELAYLYLLLGKKEYKKRVVVGVHTPLFVPNGAKSVWKFFHDLEYHSKLYKVFLRDSYMIHVNNSDYTKLVSQTYAIPKNKITFIPNPIDWNTSYRDKTTRRKFTLLWLGRFTQQKGIDRLDRIITLLKEDSPYKDIEIIIGGSGELEKQIKEIVKKHKNVKFKGFISNTLQEYQQADAVIFTAYYDTFAHAVLEPLSYGIPVISYDIPGPRDMIESKKNGYLVHTEEEFVFAIKKLFEKKKNDFDKYKRFKEKIFLATNEKYDKSYIYSQLEKILN